MNTRLYAIQGNIYKLEEEEFDVAVVFAKEGFNLISHELRFDKERLSQSKICYIVYYCGSNISCPHFTFKAYLSSFETEKMAEDYIFEMVDSSLTLARRCGNRIAFHGVQIRGMDEKKNEALSVKAVKQWLSKNTDVTVTMIELHNCFAEHI